jgi:hypothetical protein
MESHGGMILTGGNRRTQRKICYNAKLSTTTPHDLLGKQRAKEIFGSENNKVSKEFVSWAYKNKERQIVHTEFW